MFQLASGTSSAGNLIQLVVALGHMFSPLRFIIQSTTRNIFVCTSEWDTQIGKQLRAMDDRDDDKNDAQIFNSRTFSTEVGMRPAEPCSVSVAATHQLLTNLFEYICVIILSNPSYRRTTAATISEQDLQVLEKCNRENISALCDIISVTPSGEPYAFDRSRTATELRAAGDLWAEHILENAKAYIMTFIYIFATVVSGYPIVYGIAIAAGFDSASDWAYFGKSIMKCLNLDRGARYSPPFASFATFQSACLMQRYISGCHRLISLYCV
jgi:hypothetical protein